MIIILSGKQRSFLRGKANDFNPIIQIGKDGITDPLLNQVDEALTDHELVKARVLDNSGLDIKEVAHSIAEECEAEVVQVIGGVFILYRRNEEEPIYNLPK